MTAVIDLADAEDRFVEAILADVFRSPNLPHTCTTIHVNGLCTCEDRPAYTALLAELGGTAVVEVTR